MLEIILAFIGGGFLGYLLKGTKEEPKARLINPPKTKPLSQRITDVVEVEQLKKELREQQEKFQRLNQEIEQGYVKDTEVISGFTWLEYIEKLGKTSVKIYSPVWTSYAITKKLLIEYDSGTCGTLRDFLCKHFKEKPNGCKSSL